MNIDNELIKIEEKLDIKKQRFEAIGQEFVRAYHDNEMNLKEIIETFEAMYYKYNEMCDSYYKCKRNQLVYKSKLIQKNCKESE